MEIPRLQVSYPDRYRLWQELVREAELHSGRIFVATDEALERGADLELVVSVGEPDLKVVLRARVEARRPPSQRFARGLFVRLARDEVTKLHDALGLIPASEVAKGRQGRRYPMRWPVRFRTPALAKVVFTDDVSAEGMQVEMPERVRQGHILEFILETPQGHELALRGDVMWTSEQNERVGISFRFRDEETTEFFREMVELIGGFFREESGEGDALQPTVLFADDDEDALALARAALGKMAHVVTAQGGDEALSQIREQRPDVVVLDLLMSRIDGPTVCKTLRGDAELCELPVIFVSAGSEAELVARAIESGASDWLEKPYSAEALRALIERYL
jgi:CheY-like chemotaxis protein/Tfp pilus assembly protein PilZ